MPSYDVVNEGQSWKVTARFFDEDENPVTPTSARYRIVDKTTGAVIVEPADLTGLSTSKEILITAAENAMQAGSTADFEIRQLVVDFVYGADLHGVDFYEYKLLNLKGAPVG